MNPANCKPFSFFSSVRFNSPKFLFIEILFCGFWAVAVQAEVPGIIGYQGHVSVNGVPLNGTGYFKFALIKPVTPPLFISLWSNDGTSVAGGQPTQAVALLVTKGLYSLGLGDTKLPNMTTAIMPEVFNDSIIYLRVWFSQDNQNFEQLMPDTQIFAVGYALQAGSVVEGKVVKSINTLHDDLTIEAGQNIAISPQGNKLTISAVLLDPEPKKGVPSGFETITINLPNLPAGAKPLEMVRIVSDVYQPECPGVFVMGSPDTEPERLSNEGPQHRVWISQDFYLGKYEVTQAQWQAVMGSNPASGYGVGDDYPVYFVSWNDCQTFIANLNSLGQGTFRLPTEAEWEYACRAGTTTRFYWGDDLSNTEIEKYAWYYGCSSNSTHPVGEKLSNAWGLFDMIGNVSEWCQDWFGDYSNMNQKDPGGPPTGKDRVIRGGSWNDRAGEIRSAYRSRYRPYNTNFILGFRIVQVRT